MVGSRLAVHRTILVVDVERFADPARSNHDRLVVRDGMYHSLTQAFHATGVPWSECDREDRGDGVCPLSVHSFPAYGSATSR